MGLDTGQLILSVVISTGELLNYSLQSVGTMTKL